MLYNIIKPVMEHAPSEAVKDRVTDLRFRYRKMFGREPIQSWAVGKLYKWRVDKTMSRPEKPVVSDPPARWTYYNRDPGSDQLYIRKGHGAGKIKKRNDKSFFIG